MLLPAKKQHDFTLSWTANGKVRDQLPVSTNSALPVLLVFPNMHTSFIQLFPTGFRGELL